MVSALPCLFSSPPFRLMWAMPRRICCRGVFSLIFIFFFLFTRCFPDSTRALLMLCLQPLLRVCSFFWFGALRSQVPCVPEAFVCACLCLCRVACWYSRRVGGGGGGGSHFSFNSELIFLCVPFFLFFISSSSVLLFSARTWWKTGTQPPPPEKKKTTATHARRWTNPFLLLSSSPCLH